MELVNKIKKWLDDEIQSSREVIAEYTSEQRSKCEDGSDDFIEGQFDLAERLLSKIKEWENDSKPTWEELAETGMSPKMIEATLDGYSDESN